MTQNKIEGILPINKQTGCSSFFLVKVLRKLTKIKKIGHAGTLDPFAQGVMILLIGKNYTKLSDQFLHSDKEYRAKIHLGVETTTYDIEGEAIGSSSYEPSLSEIKTALEKFQGTIEQIPPMFSAKKVQGQKLYQLARKGKTIERSPSRIRLKTDLISYQYPFLELNIACSKGTYIRSLAHDLGNLLTCKGHLTSLTRTRSGNYDLKSCIDQKNLSLDTIGKFLCREIS